LHPKERDLLKLIYDFQQAVIDAGNNYSPALIANYVYDLAKEFNQFYHDCQILKEENQDIKLFRLQLIKFIAQIIKASMDLLGAKVPEQM
jgi:arginyl-tRNA synthetase